MKRGFYVESNHGFRSKKANSFSPGGIEPRQERRRAHGCKEGGEMKIIKFSVNIDKFTGFIDKFLKRNCLITDCYKRVNTQA